MVRAIFSRNTLTGEIDVICQDAILNDTQVERKSLHVECRSCGQYFGRGKTLSQMFPCKFGLGAIGRRNIMHLVFLVMPKD